MFREILAQDAARIQDQFDLVLGALDDLNVTRAMAYAIKGGKRLRGFLVLESARLHGVDASRAVWPATGIEALHAYSLVHDDLPCMDDDDLRRGRPTVHVKWDEGTAVLAGDALQTLAFELCTRPEVGTAEVRAELALTLAKASGAQGMVLGQALDIAAETAAAPLTLDEITRLQAGKTGALIEWSACAGARLAQADPGPLRQYARALGLAFQIADDILDVEGDAEKAGKRLQKDAQAGKATFVSLLGLEAAKARAAELVDQGCAALDGYGVSAETLKDAARFVIARDS
ncbi:polyprenyl synthetase family protein [Ruegeria atlantica]|uniref:polyprenyl synthetase family protein n=1 Tax=Ruegeria atlantica TaxID=81569 RepID=UPI00147C5ACA|nr:farnesyl diphosphate synthase [Ruegeria atlantica]